MCKPVAMVVAAIALLASGAPAVAGGKRHHGHHHFQQHGWHDGMHPGLYYRPYSVYTPAPHDRDAYYGEHHARHHDCKFEPEWDDGKYEVEIDCDD